MVNSKLRTLLIFATFFFSCLQKRENEKSIILNESEILQSILPELILIDYQTVYAEESNKPYNKNVLAYIDTSIFGTHWQGSVESGNLMGRNTGIVMSGQVLSDIESFIRADSILVLEADSIIFEFKTKLYKPIQYKFYNSDNILYIPFYDNYYRGDSFYRESKLIRDSLIEKNNINDIYSFSRISFNKAGNTGIFYYEFNSRGLQVIIQNMGKKWKIKKRRKIWIA